MSENMKLWNSVSKTPTKAVKEGTKGLSSINTQYYFSRATEALGPCGIGWGWEVLDRYITEGASVKHKDGDFKITQMTLKIQFWFILDGKRGEFPQFGHTPLVMKTKYGAMMDDDPEKKSLSDAIKKSLTMLGIGADIHLGQFDDISYMKELRQQEMIDSQVEKEEKEVAIISGITEYMGKCTEMYPHISTVPAINQQFKKDRAHLAREFMKLGRNSDSCINKLTELANSQRNKIGAN